jgi:hypothetical protein
VARRHTRAAESTRVATFMKRELALPRAARRRA